MDKTSWADDYKDQCDKCLDEERKKQEATKVTEQVCDKGKKEKQRSNADVNAGMGAIAEDCE